jgi:dihydrofolate synthase/folylpolyglutamate synthase
MDYSATVEFLYSLRLFGTKLGLENSFALADLCGNPQHGLRFIHVAGTNGKGSVCAMLESIYRQAGLRVGLFTSPHLISFTERIQVNRVCISQEDVSRLTAELIQRLGADRDAWRFRPTFFEFVTVLALLYFREQNCDLVIWETGMGGRLDATSIVTPLASVITNVQLDHQQWLGETLSEIAREKAGIIKPAIPVVTAASGEALEVIRATAANARSPLTVVTAPDRRLAHQIVPLPGAHQQINASVVLATVDVLQETIPVSAEAIFRGLEQTVWFGRLQQLQIGETTLLLDGAHNPDGTHALARALGDLFPGRDRTLVIGLFKDKAWQEMCDILVPGAARVFLVPIQSERTVEPRQVCEYCAVHWPSMEVTIMNSSATAMDEALQFPFVIVAGSLHLIGEVLQHLQIAPADITERFLNEWDAGRTRG